MMHGHEKSDQRRDLIVLAIRPPVFDRGIATLDIARLAQTLAERSHHPRIRGGRCTVEEPNYRHRRLLRLCCREA
jgi:hypothetical protein